MKWFVFYSLLMIGLISCTSHYKQETEAIIIPFELTDHNNMKVQAVLNDKDTVQLMFHTAVGGVSVTKEAANNLSSLTREGTEDVGSWGGSSESRYSVNNKVNIGGVVTDSLPIWEFKNSGPGTDGKFGPDVFGEKIIEIRFSESCLVIHDALPKYAEHYKKDTLINEEGMLFIIGTSFINQKKVETKFLIHSGYGGALLYDDSIAQQNQLSQYIKTTDEQTLKDSAGNEIKTLKGNLPEFYLAGIEMKDLTVGFFDGAMGRQRVSVLGGEVLKQFDWIIDWNKRNLYIKEVS